MTRYVFPLLLSGLFCFCGSAPPLKKAEEKPQKFKMADFCDLELMGALDTVQYRVVPTRLAHKVIRAHRDCLDQAAKIIAHNYKLAKNKAKK